MPKASQGVNESFHKVCFLNCKTFGNKYNKLRQAHYTVRDKKVKESRVKKSILIVYKMNSELFDVLLGLCLFYRILFFKIVFNSQAYGKASVGIFNSDARHF